MRNSALFPFDEVCCLSVEVVLFGQCQKNAVACGVCGELVSVPRRLQVVAQISPRFNEVQRRSSMKHRESRSKINERLPSC